MAAALYDAFGGPFLRRYLNAHRELRALIVKDQVFALLGHLPGSAEKAVALRIVGKSYLISGVKSAGDIFQKGSAAADGPLCQRG